jgi:hypothetical protein
MALRKLYIFVEGTDDALFFSKIFVHRFKKIYDDVEIIQYAQMKKSKVELFILSIKTLNFDYIMVADIDEIDTVAEKKRILKHKFELVDVEKIMIVIKEIESWYLAGLTNEFAISLGLDPLETTNDITKEDFNIYYIRTYRSRIDFMQEVLKHYSCETARLKNKSFDFFFKRFFKNN